MEHVPVLSKMQPALTPTPSEEFPLERTDPVGTDEEDTVSFAETTQITVEPTVAAEGEHVIEVEVGSRTIRTMETELPEWLESPL